MLTPRYAVWAAQLAASSAGALQLAGIVGALGLVGWSLKWWPEALRPWARRLYYVFLGAMYGATFVVAVAALLGIAA